MAEFFASSMAGAGNPPRERPPRLTPDSSPFASDILIAPGKENGHSFFPLADTPAIPNFALGPVYGFASVWNVASKTYSWRWDEAYRRSRQDAIAMTRDCWLMGMVNERRFPTSQRPWNLVPEDPDKAEQVDTCKYLTKCIEAPGNFETMLFDLLWSIWYGRAGIQVVWGTEPVQGRDSWTVQDYSPVNGDKIQFSWDGIPELLAYIPALTELQNRHPGTEIRYTDRSKVLVLSTPYWRDRFLINKHDRVDADFWESDQSGGLHGVGIRHWIYWLDWMRKELSSYVFDFMERVGMGFTVYYYEAGNQNAQAQAVQIAQDQGRNTWIVWPREPGEAGAAKGVERVESNAAGATFLKELCEYFDKKIERFIIGQSMSSGQDKESGLGGTGRAQFAQDTKAQLLRSDEVKAETCITRDYVRVLQRYNCPQAKFNIRFKFASETPNRKEQLEAAKNGYEMGVALDEDQVRDWIGARKPAEGSRLLQKPDAQQADQQAAIERQQAQAKLDMSQQAAQQKLETQKQLATHKLTVAEQQAKLKQEQQAAAHSGKLQATAQQQQQRVELGAQSHAAKLEHLKAVNALKQQQIAAAFQPGAAAQTGPSQPVQGATAPLPEAVFAGEDTSQDTLPFFTSDQPEPSALQEPQPPQQNEADKQKDTLLRAAAEPDAVRYSWEARAAQAGLDPASLTALADGILEKERQKLAEAERAWEEAFDE